MTERDEFLSDPGGGRDTVRAVTRTDPPGIELHDDVHGHSETLQTPAPVSLAECDTHPFCFPVDRAYQVEFPDASKQTLVVQQVANVFVRDDDARQVAEAVNRDSLRVGQGEWTVEIDTLGIKTYIHVLGELRSSTGDDSCRRVDFPNGSSVRIGIRSLHEQPAATVEVGGAPRAVMRAISCFGSALKSQSPERSFPTLRGHPPMVEVVEDADADWYDAPDGLQRRPESAELIIRVPERYDAIYPVASLAYYLDAPVVPGEPTLLTPERAIPLTGPDAIGDSLAESASRILKSVFTLDSVARTEGFYRVDLGERERVDTELGAVGLDADWETLYDASLGERVTQYLSLPYEAVAGAIPRWPVTAHVEPVAEQAAFLPFIAEALGTIRTPPAATPGPREAVADAQRIAVSDFLRDGSDASQSKDDGSDGDVPSTEPVLSTEQTVTVPRTDAISDIWCAPGHPIGGAEPTIDACKRRLAAHPSGTIDVAVVSNSPAMREEDDVAELYGLRDLLAFDVSLYEDLTSSELRAVLSSDHDLIHFVGHVSDRGLQSADGWLDVAALPRGSINARSFVLNACRSYRQGRALVDAGAIGGICTVSPIGNEPATHVGRMVARLLNVGFTLGGALDIVRDQTVTGSQYSIVGEPRALIAGGRSGTPYRAHIEPVGDGEFRVEFHCYGSYAMKLGTMFIPFLGDNEMRYLNSGCVAAFIVPAEELRRYFALERFPVTIEGKPGLHWSWELQSLGSDEQLLRYV